MCQMNTVLFWPDSLVQGTLREADESSTFTVYHSRDPNNLGWSYVVKIVQEPSDNNNDSRHEILGRLCLSKSGKGGWEYGGYKFCMEGNFDETLNVLYNVRSICWLKSQSSPQNLLKTARMLCEMPQTVEWKCKKLYFLE